MYEGITGTKDISEYEYKCLIHNLNYWNNVDFLLFH